jgi:non-ribosomal peptide synthase protein (TIGR01720 family)
VEEVLAGIWASVLGVSRVGRHDNFFELGGDSILTIQIVARARERGLLLTPMQVFEQQTVAALAAVAGQQPRVVAEQGTVTGPVPLTPIQQRFFDQNVVSPQRWNQAVILELSEPCRPELIRAALAHVLAHHDALRLRFRREGSDWHQEGPAEVPVEVCFHQRDLSGLSDDAVSAAIEACAEDAQAGLDLTRGPLVRLEHLDLGPQRPARLLWVIHHLIVDAVSWRILLEDLQSAYRQLEAEATVGLPPKTSSYQQWARRLIESSRAELRHDVDHWRQVLAHPTVAVPLDLPDGANIYGSVRTVSLTLSEAETDALVRELPQMYRLGPQEVLLACLGQALAPGLGGAPLVVDIEGHGREHPLDDVDISRTVGWFTAIFPFVIELPPDGTPLGMANAVRTALAMVPNRGLSYGALKYLEGGRDALALDAPRQIAFNHLGRFDRSFEAGGLFRPAGESTGRSCDERAARPYIWEVTSVVLGGRLQLTWSYSENLHRRSTVEGLAAECVRHVRALLAYSVSSDVVATKEDGADPAAWQERRQGGAAAVAQ